MQNLPIANTLPATPTSASSVQDTGSDQAAEPFGSVLARQRANNQEAAENGQTAPASAADTSGVTAGNEKQDATLEDAPGITEDMLAALLPTADRSSGATEANEKTGFPPYAASAGDTPPGSAVANCVAAAATIQQSAAPFMQGAPAVSGEARSAAQPLFRARDYSATAFADTSPGTPRSDIFQAAPETLGDNAVLLAPSSDGARTPATLAQPDATALIAPFQNGVGPAATSMAGATQLRLSTPLTNGSWGDDLGQKIIWMVAQREQTAELHLNPPHLGPLDVVLSVSGDQATALFASPHAAVRNAVEQALPKLREMLADNGLMLSNATVSDQFPGERQAGLDSRQQNSGGRPTSASEPVSVGTPQNGLPVWAGRRHEGMVDIFA